jgi:hypothetical protein
MKGSRNITVALIILAYYAVESYVPVFESCCLPRLQYWHVALIYWLLLGLLVRARRFVLTELISLSAFGVVVGTLLYGSTSWQAATGALSHPGIPLFMLLFVILPVMFFGLTFDPFGLVKDLPAVTNVRAPAYLLLLLSSGEMFKARSAEILEHLLVRGLDLKQPRWRIRYAHIYFPPLLLASIQEAAYRYSYTSMLGCPADRFPLTKRRQRISARQKAVLVSISLLVILRIVL